MSERAGKRECLWQEGLDLAGVGSTANPARRIYRLTERTIDKHGHTHFVIHKFPEPEVHVRI